MLSLDHRIAAANTQLAPYAVPHGGGLGRGIPEPEDDTRFPFQRDRDRIIHTDAFRRLKGKTQVFVEGQGDHYRTRLTHTMEVAQLSRDLARAMSLNEDLAECIALAHDLGHPPFGHAGEEALHQWMRERGSRFEHNEQSLRIVTVLARHCALHAGLNLSKEVLEGLQKHRTPFDAPAPGGLPHALTLEAQLVNIADEIAYNGHDCDDGLRAALFTIEELQAVDLIREAQGNAQGRGTSLRGAVINLLVSDLLERSGHLLSEQGIASLEDVYAAQKPLIAFSDGMRTRLDALRSFLWENMYTHPDVLRRSRQGQEIILKLCNGYEQHPTEKIGEFQRLSGGSIVEAIKDYVSGMTDAYARTQSEHIGSMTRG